MKRYFYRLFFRFQIYLLIVNFRNMHLLRFIRVFLQSSAVGASIEKVRYRFLDLDRILRLFPKQISIVEFGQGSSTIFFLSQNKVSSVTSIEENSDYLIRLSDRRLDSVVLPVVKATSKGIKGTKYLNSENYLGAVDLIYLDGPSSNEEFGDSALPNLDLIDVNSIHNQVIAIDCRTSTTKILVNTFKDSHFFIPSKSYLYETSISDSVEDRVLNSQDIDVTHILSSKLVRTNLLWPRNFSSIN